MSPRDRQLSGRRILIVEDELLIAMEVEETLTDLGCIVLPIASTVEQAMTSIGTEQPELVILDRNLNGQRTGSIAEELNRTGIPFVVMTGYVHGVADDPALARAPCVQKPWSRSDLLGHLNELLVQ